MGCGEAKEKSKLEVPKNIDEKKVQEAAKAAQDLLKKDEVKKEEPKKEEKKEEPKIEVKKEEKKEAPPEDKKEIPKPEEEPLVEHAKKAQQDEVVHDEEKKQSPAEFLKDLGYDVASIDDMDKEPMREVRSINYQSLASGQVAAALDKAEDKKVQGGLENSKPSLEAEKKPEESKKASADIVLSEYLQDQRLVGENKAEPKPDASKAQEAPRSDDKPTQQLDAKPQEKPKEPESKSELKADEKRMEVPDDQKAKLAESAQGKA